MKHVRPFDTLTLDDVAIAGGKNASLGEMIRELGPLGVRVPDGFALTADAYRAVLDLGFVPVDSQTDHDTITLTGEFLATAATFGGQTA